jgi:hypothetical protein
VRLAQCAVACLPALMSVALLAAAKPALAITGIQVGGPLIAQVGRMFVSGFDPVNSHLPKYPVNWSLSPGNCLAGSGITLNTGTGTLSGTPSDPGTFHCVIVAVDTYPSPVTTAQRNFTLIVEAAPQCAQPSIGSDALPAATAGAPYAFTVSASGTPAPVLSVSGLPAGLAFDAASGLISGSPDAAGTSVLTITASNGCIAPAVQTLALSVNRAATALSLAVQPEISVFGQTVSATLVASGGPPSPQGNVQICARGTGMFCGAPFDVVPPGTPLDKIAPAMTGMLDANGRADLRLAGLTIDAFVLSAHYDGDDSHLSATSGSVDELVIKGVLLPPTPGGKSAIADSASQANAIPALSASGIAALAVALAALAMAALRRRSRR